MASNRNHKDSFYADLQSSSLFTALRLFGWRAGVRKLATTQLLVSRNLRMGTHSQLIWLSSTQIFGEVEPEKASSYAAHSSWAYVLRSSQFTRLSSSSQFLDDEAPLLGH
jgi:hypothetical protein